MRLSSKTIKIGGVITSICFFVAIGAFTVFAQSSVGGDVDDTGSTVGGDVKPTTFQLQNPLDPKFNTVGGLVSGFVEIFTYLVVIAAVILLIWTGLQFVLAQGNMERMKELKNRLLYIVIGIAIVIGARVIVYAVLNTLEATGTVRPGIINSTNRALDQQ